MDLGEDSGDHMVRITAALQRAGDCDVRAEHAHDPGVQGRWRDLAEQWRSLAKQIAIGRW
jgi:hypothetical protein